MRQKEKQSLHRVADRFARVFHASYFRLWAARLGFRRGSVEGGSRDKRGATSDVRFPVGASSRRGGYTSRIVITSSRVAR